MKLTTTLYQLLGCITYLFACNSYANFTGNVTLASDYLFNGVSQTQEDPALQAGLNWNHDSGFYLGVWGSNVDFDDLAKVEVDVFAGYSHSFTENLALDFGVSQYNYFSGDNSSSANYAEAYSSVNYQQTSLSIWYAWDYFGTGANHYIVKASHTFAITHDFSLMLSADKSTSLDSHKWQWQANDDDYLHGEVTGYYTYQNFEFSLGLHATDLDHYGDTKLLFTLSYILGN